MNARPLRASSAEKASCGVNGCGCTERAPRYPWDMTDAEWEVLGPQARAVMAELRRGPGGRPMVHRLRVVVGHDPVRGQVRGGMAGTAERLGDRFYFGCLLSAAPETTPFGSKLAALPLSRYGTPFG